MSAIHMRSLQGDQCYVRSSSRSRNFDLGDDMLVVEAIRRVVSSSFERRSLLSDNWLILSFKFYFAKLKQVCYL